MLTEKNQNLKKINLSELKENDLLKLLLHLFDNKRFQEVIKIAEKVNLQNSNQFWVYYLKGSSHYNLKDYNQAINDLKKSLNINPESAVCYFQIGNVYQDSNNFIDAKYYYNQSILRKDNYIEAIINLAKLYKNNGEFEKSKVYVEEALKINPFFAEAYNLKGSLADDQNDLKNAEKFYEKAHFLDSTYDEPIYNLSLIQLYNGEFKKGFVNYNSRLKFRSLTKNKIQTDEPTWSPLVKIKNQVTIWPEQGLGDFILYSRFFNDLPSQGKHFRVLTHPKLKPLLERSFPKINFITKIDSDEIDQHLPIGDLAKFYINNFNDVKIRSEAYISVNKTRAKKINQLLPEGKKICGISWISNNSKIGKNKSMTLEDMKELLLLPDVIFVDLQYTDTSDERSDFKKKYGVDILKINEVDNFNDLDGLASLIDVCDCVVSVSNTTVHIAGSIGKKTYLMMPKGNGRLWYWPKENEQSFWYKSIQIIEQSKIGSWNNVISTLTNKFGKKWTYSKKLSLESEFDILTNIFNKENYDEVIEKGKLVLSRFNKSHLIHNIIGSAYLRIRNFNKAKYYFERSVKLNSNFPQGYFNLGYTYYELEELKLSKKYCLKALELKPNYSFPYNTLGAIYQDMSQHQKALECFKKAIEIDSNSVKPKYNLHLHYAYHGNFQEAWRYFEFRFEAINTHNELNKISGLRWNLGMSNNVYIWAEQGLGDFILYSRFLNDLTSVTDSITVLIDRKIKQLLERSFPKVNFITKVDFSKVDYHAPIGDLAKFYVNTFDDVKIRSEAYITADKSRTQIIKQMLPKGKKICGISWISKNESLGTNKSMTLEDMKELLLLPDVIFVDLQYTDTSDERSEFKKNHGVEILKIDEIDNFYDLDGLASLIDACDCVVSVSNTTAHIAGSIGKKTYLMIPQNRGRLWYWPKENEQSIWYKSIQIIEKTQVNSWDNVIENVTQKLIGAN